MSLSSETRKEIYDVLISTVRKKIVDYQPETQYMPFHYRLLGRDRYAVFSFIQSMNTTFGMSIWEQVSVILAKRAKFNAERQYRLLGSIDSDTENLINDIHYKLRKGVNYPSKGKEIERIRKSIKKGVPAKDPDSIVDVYLEKDNTRYYFDITSAKPNKKEFVALKLKLLRWIGLSLSQNPKENVDSRIVIPYNPYHPEPYERWTLQGMYDLENREIIVGEDYWNFIAGDVIYGDLLATFFEAGKTLRKEIDLKFRDFKDLSD